MPDGEEALPTGLTAWRRCPLITLRLPEAPAVLNTAGLVAGFRPRHRRADGCAMGTVELALRRKTVPTTETWKQELGSWFLPPAKAALIRCP